MKKYSCILGLVLAPNLAFAHEGIDPASILHTLAHLGEAYGLIAAVPVALAVAVVLKRRRAAARPDERR